MQAPATAKKNNKKKPSGQPPLVAASHTTTCRHPASMKAHEGALVNSLNRPKSLNFYFLRVVFGPFFLSLSRGEGGGGVIFLGMFFFSFFFYPSFVGNDCPLPGTAALEARLE